MRKAWTFFSALSIFCTLAAASEPGPDSLWLYKTDISPSTWQVLQRKGVNTIGDLKRFARQESNSRDLSEISGPAARELDTFLNGPAFSIPEAKYDLSIDELAGGPRSKQRLKAAQVTTVGQLILMRRSQSRMDFRDRIDSLTGEGQNSAVIDLIEALVLSSPSAYATYLRDTDFPARALSALKEYQDITTYQQLVRVRESLTVEEFDRWLNRIPNAGAVTKQQIKTFLERGIEKPRCGMNLLGESN